MSGHAMRQAFSLALAWASTLEPARVWAGVDAKPAIAGRGGMALSGTTLMESAGRRPAAAARGLDPRVLRVLTTSSFRAAGIFDRSPARIRGRAGQDLPGISSSRFVHARATAPPIGFRHRVARGLTDLLPPRVEKGGVVPGVSKWNAVNEAKRRTGWRCDPPATP